MSILLKNNLTGSQYNIGFGKSNIYVDSASNTIKIQNEKGNVYNTYGPRADNVFLTASRHSAISHTAALYQFDGDLTDSSGNGLDLSLSTGTERYVNILPGLKGVYLDGSTEFNKSADNYLQITGSLTIMLIGTSEVIGDSELVLFYDSGESSPTNYLYTLGYDTNGGLRYFAEHGAGSNIEYTINDTTPKFTPFHLAMTRVTGQIQFYLNGEPLGAASTGLTPADGGGTSNFQVGNDSYVGSCASLIILSRSLSAAEIKEQYNNTLGKVYGAR